MKYVSFIEYVHCHYLQYCKFFSRTQEHAEVLASGSPFRLICSSICISSLCERIHWISIGVWLSLRWNYAVFFILLNYIFFLKWKIVLLIRNSVNRSSKSYSLRIIYTQDGILSLRQIDLSLSTFNFIIGQNYWSVKWQLAKVEHERCRPDGETIYIWLSLCSWNNKT